MRTIARLTGGTLVSGASGFIGAHLCERFGGAQEIHQADVRLPEAVESVRNWEVKTLVHLAAVGRVVTNFQDIPALFDDALGGFVNLLGACTPRLVVLASSCAIYGNTPAKGVTPVWRNVHAASHYGQSKAALETAAAFWAENTGGSAVCLRVANTIGRDCGGLIPYLIRHAVRHPDGDPPAQMRGYGMIVRDYVPVKYIVDVIEAAIQKTWRRGQTVALNAGTGRSMTNGEIADYIRAYLKPRGFALRVEWDRGPASGEAQRTVLDVSRTTRLLGVPPPPHEEVISALEESVACHLEAALAQR